MSWVQNELLIYYASSDLFVCLHWKKSPVYGVFGQKPPHPASDRNRKWTWACSPPRNLPKKFRPDPSTLYLVIVVTNRQTHRQTNAGKNIIPHFCGDKYPSPLLCQGHKSGDNINIAVLHLSHSHSSEIMLLGLWLLKTLVGNTILEVWPTGHHLCMTINGGQNVLEAGKLYILKIVQDMVWVNMKRKCRMSVICHRHKYHLITKTRTKWSDLAIVIRPGHSNCMKFVDNEMLCLL